MKTDTKRNKNEEDTATMYVAKIGDAPMKGPPSLTYNMASG
jgi:hypothetical protein